MPSDRRDHAVLFHQKHLRLKGTAFSRSREHEYLLARGQVRSRCRSKGYDRRAFRYGHHLGSALIGELELSTVVGCDDSVDVRVRHCAVGTKIVGEVPFVCTARAIRKDQQPPSSHLSITPPTCFPPDIAARFYARQPHPPQPPHPHTPFPPPPTPPTPPPLHPPS